MRTVTVYTRSLCIWCWRAKRALRANGVAFREVDASDAATRAMLLERVGRPTVPQIFFDEESIGGFDDLRALMDRGELHARLASPA